MEVVAAFPDGYIWAIDSTGQTVPGWPKQTGAAIDGAPAIADLFGDGRQEVIAGSQDGKVYAWDAGGNLLPGWPQCGCYGTQFHFNNFVIGSPVVGDLFGNGQKEIVAGDGYYAYAWDTQGRLLSGFPVFLFDSTVATPALVDLDHNGQLWIVTGGDSIPNQKKGSWYAIPPSGCPYPNASRAGCDHAGWPITVDDTPWSSPVGVNGFEQDGGGSRVWAGTGHYYSQTIPCSTCGKRINAWNSDGSPVSGWPYATGGPNYGSVAMGDLGLNNSMEQVVAQSENGTIYVVNANGSTVYTLGGAVVLGSPAIGPVSNSAGNGVWFGDNGGHVFGYDKSGTQQDVAALEGGGTSFAAPTIAALGSGPELITTSVSGSDNWTVAAYAIPSPGSGGSRSRSWPTFHGDMERNGGQPPVATITSPANGSTATHSDFDVTWSLATLSVPANKYVLWTRDVTANAGWQLYTNTTAQSAHFYGTAGHQYAFFVDAQNALGSANLAKTDAYTATSGSGIVRAATYVPMTPYRIVDTRTAYCTQCGAGHLNPYETRTIHVGNSYAPPGYTGPTVPASATAAVLNVTAVSATASTYFSVFPTGSPRPNASSLNSPQYSQVANLVTVALGTAGQVDVFNNSAVVDLVVDVEGYYTTSGGSSGEYHPLAAPVRVCDSRGGHGTGCNSGSDNPLGPGSVRAVTVAGSVSGTPSDGTAASVVMNLTGVVGTAGTYLTVFPPDPTTHACGTPPTASNLNLPAFTSQPNRVIMPVDPTTQQVCIFNANGSINFAVDVSGWYGNGSEASLASGMTFHPMSPQRVCDTRPGQGTLCSGLTFGGGQTRRVQVSTQGGLPGSGIGVVVLNATILAQNQATYISIYADGAANPGTSDLNAEPHGVLANLVMVALPSDGQIGVTNANPSADFIADAVGWFA